MRSSAPPLLPVLRSHTQGRVLAALLLHPGKELTQSGLAEDLDIPMSTVADEVRRLLEAGIVEQRRVGNALLLRASPGSRLTPVLTQLLAMTYGPAEIVSEEFVNTGAVVVLFGSWAARWHGMPGKEPGDVDVLVLGDVDRGDIYEAAVRVEERVGFPVNPVIRPTTTWTEGGDPLVDDIREKPYVVVLGAVDDKKEANG